MKAIDRRALTRAILFGAAAAAAGLAGPSETASAMPLDGRIPGSLDDWIEKTQVWVGPGPRRGWRRRRVRRCWWSRGRRVLRLGLGVISAKRIVMLRLSVMAPKERLRQRNSIRSASCLPAYILVRSVAASVVPAAPANIL
ncbi:MAG TPA: hypothetical protein VGH00_00550 [Chthoniobacterales bacterium]